MTDDMVMPTADGNMGSVSTPIPEGNIDDGSGTQILFGEVKTDTDRNGDRYAQIWVHYIDDEAAKANIYCALHRPDGLAKLVDVICISGVAARMKKNGSMKNDPTKGIPTKILESEKFLEQLDMSLAGCKALASVKHRDKKMKKDDGEEITFTESVITRLAAFGPGGAKSGNTSKPATGKVPANDADNESDWS